VADAKEANLDLVVDAGIESEVVQVGLEAPDNPVRSVLQQVPSQDTPEPKLDRDWKKWESI
jgi:hypothetical protein